MLLIYKAGTALAAPLGAAFICCKRRRDPPYGKRVFELLGFHRQKFSQSIWFHAASMGEVNSIKALVVRFAKEHPGENIILTTLTTTGMQAAQNIEGITPLYSPLDSGCVLRRFFNTFHPKALFIVDTELWPNMLDAAAKHKIPVTLINARMMESSCEAYSHMPDLVHDLMASKLNRVLCISKDDARRFRRIGVAEDRLLVTGNIKYDLTLNEELFAKSRRFRKESIQGPVFGAISTHDGEEELILQTWQKLQKTMPQLSLVLVPRHKSGVEHARKWLKDNNLTFVLREDKAAALSDFTGQVLLGSTMGEIEFYFGLCDLVFMGGSFVETGGHNPLEPAYFSLPIITGPNYQNFKEPFDKLIDAQGAFTVSDDSKLCKLVSSMLNDPKKLKDAGIRALEVQQQGGGAMIRTLKEMEKDLGD